MLFKVGKMSKTKIAFCIPNMVIGGLETVFINTLTEMAKNKDFDITVIMHQTRIDPVYRQWFAAHPDIHVQIMYPWAVFFENLKKYIEFFPLKNIRKIIFSIYKSACRHRIKKCDADIFIDYKNCSFRKEMRLINRPKITWIHGSINHFKKFGYNNYVGEYDRVVCLTDDFLNDFKRQYPEHASSIVRIYNPIDAVRIKRLAWDGKKYNKDSLYFCCVSRLDTDKDIATLIAAFDMFYAREKRPECKLIIVGDGPAAMQFKQMAAKTGAHKNIIFVGAAANPFGYISNAIAHILSSRNEGFGMVLAEAGALGILNISADCKSGPREILLDGAGGLLFEPGNSQQLSQIMSDVWNKRCDTRRMIRTMTAGLGRFDAKNIAAQITDLITQQVQK